MADLQIGLKAFKHDPRGFLSLIDGFLNLLYELLIEQKGLFEYLIESTVSKVQGHSTIDSEILAFVYIGHF